MGPGTFRANAPALDVPAIERDLARIPAVTSARVVVEDDQLNEIHVVCGPGRSPKLINRDVQSLLAARWGVDIDHRKVSVVQLDEEDIDLTAERAAAEASAAEEATPAPTTTTPTTTATATATARVSEIAVSVSDDKCEATVTITVGERRASGHATGVPTGDGQCRAAAGATLVALTSLDPRLAAFGVSDVARVPVGGGTAVVTTLSGWRDGAEHSHVGAATVGPLGELRASADAVLRAIV